MTLLGRKGFIGLIEILISAIVISLLTVIVLKAYYHAPNSLTETNKLLKDSSLNTSINTSNYQALINSTRSTLSDISEQHLKALENQSAQLGY